MRLQVDPEGNEVRALRRAGPWRGKRVLEIGCGEGRLTLRLAGLGARVDAIDPDAGQVTVVSGQPGGERTTIKGGDGVWGVHSSRSITPSHSVMIGRPPQSRPMVVEHPT